jgi:predicted ATPase
MSAEYSVVCAQLIGRTTTIELLHSLIEQARRGQGQVALVGGEAGIGKSRLIAEAKAAAQGFLALQGNCFEQDASFPYAPLVDALRSYFARCTPGAIRVTLGPLASEFVKLLPELALLLPDVQPTPVLDPEAEKRRLFEALALFLTRLAQTQPLLVVVEDIHWSDETSLDFLHFFARRLAASPILLIASYRREDAPPRLTHILAQFDRARLAHEVVLSPLTPTEVEAMLRTIFELDRPVRAEFLDLIVPLTEGDPFFIEEVLKALN